MHTLKSIGLFTGIFVLVGISFLFSALAEGESSVQKRLVQYGPRARKRLKPLFLKASVKYPPKKVVFVGLKREKKLQLYAASNDSSSLALISEYPILAASGNLGPKLRQGDLQVPEGFYRISYLNPNSRFHLSLRINYPNSFDRAQAKKEGRKNLGGDIMIHGNMVSIGCLAMGDQVAENLFILAADVGMKNISVILSPIDFRNTTLEDSANSKKWVLKLYEKIATELKKLPQSQTRVRPLSKNFTLPISHFFLDLA